MPRWETLYLDPPWHFAQRSAHSKSDPTKPTKFAGGACDEYPLMEDEELLAIAPMIDALTEKTSSMHLWVTGSRFDFGMQFLLACGFKFSTVEYVWIKLNKHFEKEYGKMSCQDWIKYAPFKGTGSYTMSNAEFIILGTKGSIGRRHGEQKHAQVVLAPHPRYPKGTPPILVNGERKKREGKIIHSAKPSVFRDLIATSRPDTRKVELFCRAPAPGWEILGNDVQCGLDIKEALSCHLLV